MTIRVLLLESNAEIVTTIRRGLALARGEKIEVTPAPRLADGLGLAAKARFDVAVVALDLPDGGGLEVLASLKHGAPDLPLVALAPERGDELGLRGVKLGAQDYLVRGAADLRDVARAVRYAVERRRLWAQIQHAGLHDGLTALPNRALFLDRLRGAIERAARRSEKLGVIYFDFDGLRQVNELHGLQAGDELLRQIAARLKKTARKADTVARIGGDEFALVIEAVADIPTMLAVAKKIRDHLSRPYRVAVIDQMPDTEIRVTATAGLALYPDHGEAIDDLLVAAMRAMDQARRSGKGVLTFH